jgi:hypothetical protein
MQLEFYFYFKGRWEDQEICNCFRKLGIYPGESRDEMGRERFHMESLEVAWLNPSEHAIFHSKYKVKSVI